MTAATAPVGRAALATLLLASLAAPSAVAAAAVDAAAAASPPPLPMVGFCNVQTAQLHSNWLGMYCNNRNAANFAYNWAWIDLDWCLANRGGHLVGRKLGRYHSTCSQCSARLVAAPAGSTLPPGAAYTDGHTLDLRCACRDVHGHAVAASIDLNTVLLDVDGALGCYGRLGNKTQTGPPPPT